MQDNKLILITKLQNILPVIGLIVIILDILKIYYSFEIFLCFLFILALPILLGTKYRIIGSKLKKQAETKKDRDIAIFYSWLGEMLSVLFWLPPAILMFLAN